MSKNFSEKRLIKFIESIESGKAFKFSDINRLGGSRGKITSFLKNCIDVELVEKRLWRKL